jgi:hypothetical protein
LQPAAKNGPVSLLKEGSEEKGGDDQRPKKLPVTNELIECLNGVALGQNYCSHCAFRAVDQAVITPVLPQFGKRPEMIPG